MSESPVQGTPKRTPLLIAVSLLVLTLAVGIAARQGPPAPTPTASRTPGAKQIQHDQGPVGVTLQLDRTSVMQGTDGLLRMELVLRGEASASDAAARVPTDFVVVLDRSGSMQGRPLELAKAAVQTLLEGLAPEDRFALVSYANVSRTDIPLTASTPGTRAQWRWAVEQLKATGGTNMSSGLDLGHDIVAAATRNGRVARMILLSDGHANQGDPSLSGLRQRARRAVQSEYVVSSIGLGSGFDESVMSSIADAGTGNFYYLPDAARLASIFVDEFASARETVANALRIAFAAEQGVSLSDVAGYPLEREGNTTVFYPGTLFAGQERRLWLTLQAPTHTAGEIALGRLSLRYADNGGASHEVDVDELPSVACVEREEDYYASFDKDAYRRSSGEVLGSLKRRVAAKMKAGRQEEAVAEVELELEKLEMHQIRGLGYAIPEDMEALSSLRDSVSAPSAASPSVQNQLGKQLLQEGLDESRSGAKR
jgi:Ca-activated chloride channel family protein